MRHGVDCMLALAIACGEIPGYLALYLLLYISPFRAAVMDVAQEPLRCIIPFSAFRQPS